MVITRVTHSKFTDWCRGTERLHIIIHEYAAPWFLCKVKLYVNCSVCKRNFSGVFHNFARQPKLMHIDSVFTSDEKTSEPNDFIHGFAKPLLGHVKHAC